MNKKANGPLHNQIAEQQKVLFYSRKILSSIKDFKSFNDVNDNSLKKIHSKIETMFPSNNFPLGSKKRYIAVLKYLSSSLGNKDFPTIDEKIIFLIQAIDPEVSIYYILLSGGFSNHYDEQVKRAKSNLLIGLIEHTIGFFDRSFLICERLYFEKFLKVHDIISFVNVDYTTGFLDSLSEFKGFIDMDDASLNYIYGRVAYYKEHCKDFQNPNTVCFNMKNPNSSLELWKTSFKVAFFILLIDPELRVLQIYEQECQFAHFKERVIAELGFYHENLLKIEKLYKARFCPELKFDAWTM